MTTGRINQVAPCGPAPCSQASAGLSRVWPAGARTGDLVWLLSGQARQPERLTLGCFLAPPFREAPLYPSPARARRLGGPADRSQQASRRVGRCNSRRPRTLFSDRSPAASWPLRCILSLPIGYQHKLPIAGRLLPSGCKRPSRAGCFQVGRALRPPRDA